MKCYFLSKRKAFDLRIDIGQLKLNMKKKNTVQTLYSVYTLEGLRILSCHSKLSWNGILLVIISNYIVFILSYITVFILHNRIYT